VDDAFHLYLRRGLHKLYDDVTKEFIPPDLLRIIENGCAAGEE